MAKTSLIQKTTAPEIVNLPNSQGKKKDRLYGGTWTSQVAVQILQSGSKNPPKLSLLNRLIVWLGKKWWAQTTIQDEKGNFHKILVNINSAVKRLGLTRAHVLQVCDHNDLLLIDELSPNAKKAVFNLNRLGVDYRTALAIAKNYQEISGTKPLHITPDRENRWIVFYNKQFLVFEKKIKDRTVQLSVRDIIENRLVNWVELFGARGAASIRSLNNNLELETLLQFTILPDDTKIGTILKNLEEISEQLPKQPKGSLQREIELLSLQVNLFEKELTDFQKEIGNNTQVQRAINRIKHSPNTVTKDHLATLHIALTSIQKKIKTQIETQARDAKPAPTIIFPTDLRSTALSRAQCIQCFLTALRGIQKLHAANLSITSNHSSSTYANIAVYKDQDNVSSTFTQTYEISPARELNLTYGILSTSLTNSLSSRLSNARKAQDINALGYTFSSAFRAITEDPIYAGLLQEMKTCKPDNYEGLMLKIHELAKEINQPD